MSDLPPPPPPGHVPAGPVAAGGLPYPLTPPREKADLPPSGPGSPGIILPRIGARLIDQVITTAPFQIIIASAYTVTRGDERSYDGPMWFLIVALIVPVIYEIAMTTWRGQTIGKMLLRLKVLNYPDGGTVNVQQSSIRAILPIVPSLLAFAIPSIGAILVLGTYVIFLSAVFDVIYRGWPDKAAGTIVLRTR
jgi:uncharacterized RDD family membrane protein YckC